MPGWQVVSQRFLYLAGEKPERYKPHTNGDTHPVSQAVPVAAGDPRYRQSSGANLDARKSNG